MGTDAHTRIPSSLRRGVQSADRRAQRRGRNGGGRRRQLSGDLRRRGLGQIPGDQHAGPVRTAGQHVLRKSPAGLGGQQVLQSGILPRCGRQGRRAQADAETAMTLPLRLAVFLIAIASVARPEPAQSGYEVYAVRFGVIPQFRVSGLVAGADPARRLDIPVMVWLLKGNGRNVLVDSGFHQQTFVDQWKVQNFRSPADAVLAAGVKPEQITDVIVTHAHWDHAGGLDLFPKATVWIQRDEYEYYTGEAWQARNTHGGIDA